jgi:hypothetical protein
LVDHNILSRLLSWLSHTQPQQPSPSPSHFFDSIYLGGEGSVCKNYQQCALFSSVMVQAGDPFVDAWVLGDINRGEEESKLVCNHYLLMGDICHSNHIASST